MSVKIATGELLLDTLADNSDVKAAVLVDDRGYVLERRGDALSLKSKTAPKPEPGTAPSENLYLVAAGKNFLVVVFDERQNFERLKAFVDDTLGEFGMGPLPED